MNKTLLVIKETYRRQVKSWSFLFMVLAPFLFFLIGFLFSFVNNSEKPMALVSNNAVIQKSLPNNSDFTNKYSTVTQAKKAVKDSKADSYVTVNINNNQIVATYHGDHLISRTKNDLHIILAKIQNEINLQNAHLTPKQLHNLTIEPIIKQATKKTNPKNNTIVKTISLSILLMAMYFIIISYASVTAQEIATEKGTKIMEVIFSSMKGQDYFIGKIVGVLCVVATQVLVYVAGGGICYVLASHLEHTKKMFIQIKPMVDAVLHNLVSWSLVFVLLGLVLFIITSAIAGALVTRIEDVNKAVQPVIYLILAGFFGALYFANHPQGIILNILSYVPFMSSFMMPIRIINGSANIFEIIISILILITFTIALTQLTRKIYPKLILQTDDIGIFKTLKRGFTK